MNKTTRTFIVITGVLGATFGTGMLFASNTTIVENVAPEVTCQTAEEMVREMNEDQLNSVLIEVAKTLAENKKAELRPKYEQEMEANLTHAAETQAVKHIHEVNDVLVKSIGSINTIE